MEPFAHDVDELKRLLDELGEDAFELAYIEYCVALLAEDAATSPAPAPAHATSKAA